MTFSVGRDNRHPKGIRLTELDTAETGPCGRCGEPADGGGFCAACIDRCHEATEFDHICQVCASPDEARTRGWAVTP